MGLESPRLDDRSFEDIVNEARARIAMYAPEWTDHNLSDPGITLIELFAWMTDIVLYRLNRVPDKHFIKFMELIGMKLGEATPARADVTFWLSAPQSNTVMIPGGTEVATVRTETDTAIVFSTDGDMQIQPARLSYLLTSVETGRERGYRVHNVSAMMQGYETITVFGSEPMRTDDALYIGFDQDLSNHLIGLQLQVQLAEGAGINPGYDPPYIWEVLGSGVDQRWVPIRVDYDNTRGMNVDGLIRLHLPYMRRTNRAEYNAYWVRCRLDVTDPENRYAVSPQIKRLNVATWGGTVGATNISRVQREVLGRSDGTPGQVFYLEHVPLLARSADEHVLVNPGDGREQRWQEVSDFSGSTGVDRHYTLDSQTGELRFGPALQQQDGQVKRFGAIPPKGAMIMMSRYRYGGGRMGNVSARTINVLKAALPYVERVTNLEAAVGGLDTETLENAKMRVPGFLRSMQRAVTAQDYEYLALESSPERVGRVYCLQPPLTQRGENIVLVVPHVPVIRGFISPESLELPADVRQRIQSYLDERRLLSTRLEVRAPSYQWVETEVYIHVSRHYDPEKVQQAVEDRLFTFISPLTGGTDGQGWVFGRDLLASDVIAVLLAVPGVEFVRNVKLYPVVYEDRSFTRGKETMEIALPSHGIVVSYQHSVITTQ
jgi:predicted phage baseplate assembly protein